MDYYQTGQEMAAWYYTRNGEKRGPVDSEHIRKLAASGDLLPTDMLWKEGMKNWIAAGDSPKLFPSSAGANATSSSTPPAIPQTCSPSTAVPDEEARKNTQVDSAARRGNIFRDLAVRPVVFVPSFILVAAMLVAVGGRLFAPPKNPASDAQLPAGTKSWDEFVARVNERLQRDAFQYNSQNPSNRRAWRLVRHGRVMADTAQLVAEERRTIGKNTRTTVFELDYALQAGLWRVASGLKRDSNSANGFREESAISVEGFYANNYLAGLFADQ